MRVCVALAANADSALLGGWMADLPPKKRERIGRYRKESDTALAVTAHRLLALMLREQYGIVPRADQWAVREYGKPYLLGEDVHFNISHSGQMVMCAVHDGPVGVDIERRRPVNALVADRIMSEEEKRAYGQAADKDTMFFRIWTLKEAYIKYLGTGMRTSLSELTIYQNGGSICSNVDECTFTVIGGVPGYQAAVCADTPCREVAEWIGESALAVF